MPHAKFEAKAISDRYYLTMDILNHTGTNDPYILAFRSKQTNQIIEVYQINLFLSINSHATQNYKTVRVTPEACKRAVLYLPKLSLTEKKDITLDVITIPFLLVETLTLYGFWRFRA